MIEPVLVPFKAEHWMRFVQLGATYESEFRGAIAKEQGGPAFTAILEDQILACAGIIVHHQGMGYAWSILSSLSKGYPIWMTRTIKYMIRDVKRGLNLHRLELIVDANELMHQRWAEKLGFVLERDGRARMFLPDKGDVIRYEMVDK